MKPWLRQLPHAPGYTLAADAYMEPSQLVGFSIAHQPLSVFMHYHEFYELALVIQGTGLHMTAAGEQRVHRGTVIFVAPGVAHGYRMGEDLVVYNGFLRVEAAQFDLPWARRDEWLGHLFGPPGVEPRLPAVVTVDEETLVECIAHLDAIRERPADERSEAYDLGHLLLALDVLARHFRSASPEQVAINPRAPAVVSAAVDLLEHDLQRRWTLDELAARLFVGTFHLVRLFDRWVGLPPIAYLHRRRAERAATLLATTDAPVAEIGGQVGWPDPSNFSRRFRQAMGVSPSAYRATSRVHYAARRGRPRADVPADDDVSSVGGAPPG
jgi:AraC family L-rhamnose operon transcriptional activator RhaR